MSKIQQTTFVPMLAMKTGTTDKDIEFYKKGLGAVEQRRWSNGDGSIHVIEMMINGAMFHMHEETRTSGSFPPDRHNGVTTKIGLMVDDVHAVMDNALAAGATERSPVTDYDYGYRQAEFTDPMGHHWIIEKQI